MAYYFTKEELEHSFKGTGWKNHKYISKFVKNGKVVYVYGNQTTSNKSNGVNDLGNSIGNFVNTAVRKGEKFISNILTKITTAKYKIKQANPPTSGYLKNAIDNLVKKRQNDRIQITSHSVTLNGSTTVTNEKKKKKDNDRIKISHNVTLK